MGNFSSKEAYFKFILYFLVIVLINVVGISLFFRADLTKGGMYSLSPASEKVVSTLSEPLSIKVFFSKDLPAPHNNTERYLKDLLEEYAAKADKQFNYTFYNVTPDEGNLMQKADENRTLARDYGIQPIQIRIMENDEVKFKNAYMGLVIIHGDLIEKLPAITSTSGLEYQLTAAIEKLNNKVSALLRIDKKIKVDLYLSQSLGQLGPILNLKELPKLGQMVADMVEKLNSRSLGIIDFNHVIETDQTKLMALVKKHNLLPLSWKDMPKEGIKAGFGAAGLVVTFKGESTTLPLLSAFEMPIFGTQYEMADPALLEQGLNNVIEKMVGINKNIGFLSSHGTHKLTQNRAAMMQGQQSQPLQAFNTIISSRYTVKQIDLKKSSISDGLNCLIIARPTEKFSDYELFQIDQALMKGTNIAFISDTFKQVSAGGQMMGMPPMHVPIDSGLEKLLLHYGIKIQNAYVLDKECYRQQMPQNRGGGEQNIYFAPMLKGDSINTDPGFMNNIKGMISLQISPLELVQEKIDSQKITATKLLSSSSKSWLMETVNLNPIMIIPPKEEKEFMSYDIAYMLEGSFTSFFKGKDIPKKEMTQKKITDKKADAASLSKEIKTDVGFIETGKPAKIFVLPSSQMIQDNILDPQGRTPNAVFILNAIDHLNNQDDIAQLRAKQQTFNPIDDTSPATRGWIKAFNIIGLPIIVSLFGLGVLAKRTARKKKLNNRFNV